MKPVPPDAWPPVIDKAVLPRPIVWRDRLCTAAMWLLLAWLCRRPLEASWMALQSLVTKGLVEFPFLLARWELLRPYFIVVGALAVWQMLWTAASLWRRFRYAGLPQPAALTLEEEAGQANCSQADLLAWRKLRIVVVDLDDQGRPAVRPK